MTTKTLTVTDINRGNNRQQIVDKVVEAITACGWEAMAEQFRDEPDKRERITLFIGHKIAEKLGLEKGAQFTDLAMTVVGQ